MVQYIAPGSGHKKPGASLCSLGYCGQEVVQLLVESAQEFADTVQTHGAACDRGDSDEDLSLRLLVHSRRYLRHMDACAAAARARLGGADPLLKEHLQVLGAALAAACAVWQLAEALLLHDAHGVAWPVVRWLRDRVDADLEPFLLDAERRLQTSSHPELRSRLASAAPQRDEPWFYMLVAHLLLRGDFARAAAALRAHGDCGSDGGSDAHVREVIELIESYPDFPAVSKAAGAEQPMAALQRRFASDFGRFQTECRIVRDGIRTAAAEAKAGGGCGDVDVKDLGELANLCALMGGDLGALKRTLD